MELLSTSGIKFLLFNYEKQSGVGRIAPSVLPYLDLTYCINGEMEYRINGEKVFLKSGDAILFPPGSTRERIQIEKPCLYASFNVRFDKKCEFEHSGHIKGCITPSTIYLLESFKKDFATVSANKKEKCLATFSYLYYELMEKLCDAENPHVHIIKQYISDNLSCPLTIEDIASRVHLAPQYVCSLFKKETGSTIIQYVINRRIDLAKRLLVTSDDPIYVIAEHCGFSDYNYFSHTFKKVTGVSAVSFRKIRLNMIKSGS